MSWSEHIRVAPGVRQHSLGKSLVANMSQRTALMAVLVFTVVTIGAAWAFQLIGGYMPCLLCYRQRLPYYIAVILGLLLLPTIRRAERSTVLRYGLLALGLIMLVSAGMGLHHAGVEWGWWAGPDSCATGAGFRTSGNILPDLDNPVIVSCTEAQWRLFGLSFAGYNALISLAIAIIAFWGARK